MTSDYQQRASTYDQQELRTLWGAIKARNTPDWANGKAFEHLVLRAFEIEGAVVRWPYDVDMDGSRIEQIDGVVYTNGLSCLIESKDQQSAVNVEPLAKLRNQLLRRPAGVIGIVFSSSGFTDPASTLARFTSPQTILLWSGDEIEYALEHSYMLRGLTAKYRVAVEMGLPDYNIRIEDVGGVA